MIIETWKFYLIKFTFKVETKNTEIYYILCFISSVIAGCDTELLLLYLKFETDYLTKTSI